MGVARLDANSLARIMARLFRPLPSIVRPEAYASARHTTFVNMVNGSMPVATSTDPVAVANLLRPVLLQLGRRLRREVHPLGVTGGQVALLATIHRSPGIGLR